jgi:hypothetical protein
MAAAERHRALTSTAGAGCNTSTPLYYYKEHMNIDTIQMAMKLVLNPSLTGKELSAALKRLREIIKSTPIHPRTFQETLYLFQIQNH